MEAMETSMKMPAKGTARPNRPTFFMGSAATSAGTAFINMPIVTTTAPSMMDFTGVQRLTSRVMSSWKATIMMGLAAVRRAASRRRQAPMKYPRPGLVARGKSGAFSGPLI
jgi:hypothetical protein